MGVNMDNQNSNGNNSSNSTASASATGGSGTANKSSSNLAALPGEQRGTKLYHKMNIQDKGGASKLERPGAKHYTGFHFE